MLAANAIPMGKAPASPSRSPASTPPPARTATAMGIMMRVVEVFEISIDRIAAAIMKASSRPACPPRPPSRLRIPSASRRCRPVRSIASAMNPPPNSRNRMSE